MKQLRWWKQIGSGLAVVLLFAVGPQMCARGAGACFGYGDVVERAIEECPEACEALGEDVEPGVVGLACGQTETSGGSGTASWRMSFVGDRGRGSVEFDAEMHGGAWELTRATLHANDRDIDLVACAREKTAPAEARDSLADATVAKCERGDGPACVVAGAMYESGHLVLRDADRARALYHAGCVAGHAPACRLEDSQ